jgi:hypothetical protein
MPVIRKIVKILAPRTSLAPPDNLDAGDPLLEGVRGLIEQGLDPEIALEASLRKWIERASPGSGDLAEAGIRSERGRDFA